MVTDNRNRTDVAAPQPPAPAAAGRGFWAWLERKLLHPIFLFVALLIAALMVRPLIYAEQVNPLALWLVGLLVLLAIMDLLPTGAGGFPGWLGSRLVRPIFLFVALLLAALMVRPVIYGQAVSGAALWLVGVLILLAFLDLADVSRFQKPQTAHKLEDIPPLGLVKGSVRALTGLILLVAFFFFLLAAPKIVPDNKEFLEKAVMLIGGWLGVVIGFYFGNRAAEKAEKEKPPGEKPPTPTGTTATPGATTTPGAAPTPEKKPE